MALNPQKRDGFSKSEQEFLRTISEFGWHVMYIAPREGSDDAEEWWGYSTGLYYHFEQPEIVLFGLRFEDTVGVVNSIGAWLKQGGRIRESKEYKDFFETCTCTFKSVGGARVKEYLCWADWFYERKRFPVMQCLWSDSNGYYPWERKCHPAVVKGQPLLFKKPQANR